MSFWKNSSSQPKRNYRWLVSFGSGPASANTTISKNQATQAGLGDLMIEVLDPNGTAIETWNLNNVFIKAAKFGDLDYSNDELRTIEMTIRYDWAHCTLSGGPNFNPIN